VLCRFWIVSASRATRLASAGADGGVVEAVVWVRASAAAGALRAGTNGVDLDGLGFAGGELVIGEGEAGGFGLQAGEQQNEGVLQGIGPGGIGAGKLGEAFGLLLAVGGLTAEVLDHPAGGIGLGGQGLLVVFLGEEGGLQFGEGLGAGVVVIGIQLLGELADGGGELLGLAAQLPEGAGALQGAGRACYWRSR